MGMGINCSENGDRKKGYNGSKFFGRQLWWEHMRMGINCGGN